MVYSVQVPVLRHEDVVASEASNSRLVCIKFPYSCKCTWYPLSEVAQLTFEGDLFMFVKKLYTVCRFICIFYGPNCNLIFWKIIIKSEKMTAQFLSN